MSAESGTARLLFLVEGVAKMNRIMIASVLGGLLFAGPAAAVVPQTPESAAPAAPAAPAVVAPAPQPEAAPFPADSRIGYVDPQVVLENSLSGKAGLAELSELVAQKQAEIQAKNTEIQTLNQEIASNQAVWSAAVAGRKQAELTAKQNELQYMQTQA